MEFSHKAAEFSFVVSTPSDNALARRETQMFVRQHVNRRFNRSKICPDKFVRHNKALAGYLPRRQPLPEKGDGRDLGAVIMGSPSNAAALLGASRPNPFARYPVRMGVKEHEFIHFSEPSYLVTPPRPLPNADCATTNVVWASRQVIFQPFRDYWFSLGMMDPAAMHLVLANAAMHRKMLRTSPEDDFIALSHSTRALKSVRERIGNSNLNVTDEMLGAVLGLYCHNFLALRFEECALHLNGFQKIVQIRGGLSSIDSIPSIRMSVFWIEHNICAAQDTIPQLPPPYHLLTNPYSTAIRSRGRTHCEESIAFSRISGLISLEVLDVLRGLSTLAVSFKGRSVQKISLEDPNFSGFAFYSELYILLSMQSTRSDDTDKSDIQEMIRLGGLLFLAEVRRSLSISPVMTEVQASKLHKLLDRKSVLWSQELDSLRTWAIVMAGCAASTAADRSWASEALIYAHEFTAYKSWDDVHKVVSKMWWIDTIFSLNCFTDNLLNETRF